MKYRIIPILLLLPVFLFAQNAQNNLSQVYKVKKGDTAFSIAQKHGITLEQLYRANPEIAGGKVKKGSFVAIPSATPKASATPVPTAPQATPTTQVAPTPRPVRASYESLRVAVLLPFEEETPRAAKFLEFYRGFLMAVDSVSAAGTNVTVYALNTGATAASIRQVLEEPELQSMQIIFGPADQSQVPALSDFCQEHGIKLVLPFANLRATSGIHSTIYNATPAGATIQQRFCHILAERFADKNYVILRTDNPDDKGQGLVDQLRTSLGAKGVAMRQVNIGADNTAYESALNEFRDNCIVPDNVGIKTLNIFFSRIKEFAEQHPGYKISLVGYPEWQTYTQSLLNDFYQYDTYIYTSYFRHPLSEHTSSFERRFIHHFGCEMASTFPRYGMLGFDLGYYFMHGMATLGDHFDTRQQSLELQPVQHHFQYVQDADTQSYVNESTLIIHYSPEQTIDILQ